MKKIILLILAVIVIVYLFPKPYLTSPGYTTQEYMEEFNRTKKKCMGYSFDYSQFKNYQVADAPEKELCFGWLTK